MVTKTVLNVSGENVQELSPVFAEILEDFAVMLDYPSNVLQSTILRCQSQLTSMGHNTIADSLSSINGLADTLSQGRLEETYSSIFDMNPSNSLYVGYQILGDSYKRSDFMIKLADHYTNHGFTSPLPKELPDYLPVILRFLAMNDNLILSKEIIDDALLPALEKLVKKFEGSTENPPIFAYFSVLRALTLVLQHPQLNSSLEKNLTPEDIVQ